MVYELSNNTWDDTEKRAIMAVVESNNFTMGQRTKNFEEAFAEKFEAKYAVFVNSGSSANLLAVSSLVYSGKLSRGDEIIVPAVSWSTTYTSLVHYGLKLVFVDIDKHTLNIDPDKIDGAIGAKTKAVFAVNLLGNPAQYDVIIDICQKNNLVLLEDNCESMGATFMGRYTGGFGLIGTHSTFFSHHICTMEGGIILVSDELLYHYMISLRAHGWTRDIPRGSKLYEKDQDDFYEMYNFVLPGYNLRPLEIEAAIGLLQIAKLDQFIDARRSNAQYFQQRLSILPGVRTQKETGESSWFGFPVVLDKGLDRKEVINRLRRENIEVRPIVGGNFTRNAVMSFIDYRIPEPLTNADDIHFNGFFIGNHSINIQEKIDFFVDVLQESIK